MTATNTPPRRGRARRMLAAVAALAAALALLSRCTPDDTPACGVGRTSCEVRENCPGTDSACVQRSCDDGCCGTAVAEAGTRVLVHLNPSDDCLRLECDAHGGVVCVKRADGSTCGDGHCAPDEGCDVCPEDCDACPAVAGPGCGDHQCDPYGGEGCANCPEDCGVCCGDGVCEAPYETCAECAEDCGCP